MTEEVSPAPVVTMDHIAFDYAGRTVFDDLCLTIDGGLTFLVGENGVGKTTLFKLLLGALTASAGVIRIGGVEVAGRTASASLRQRIGYLPQDFQYPAHAKAGDLVCYLAWLRGVPRRQARRAATEALGAVGLDHVQHRPMRSLSGGMVRRVGIAQALAHCPSILLLDEPTVGLDPEQRVRLRELLRTLAGGVSVVSSTHLLEDAGLTGGRMVVVGGGRVRFTGTATDLVGSAPGTAGAGAASPLEAAYLNVTRSGGLL